MTRYADGHPHREGAMIEDGQTKAAAPVVPETIYQVVERVLDEHSAWIARPSPDVTKAIALAAGIAWSLHLPVEPDAKGEETVDGWQLVPKVPTEDMLTAASMAPDDDDWQSAMAKAYRAMLAAAPPPSPIEPVAFTTAEGGKATAEMVDAKWRRGWTGNGVVNFSNDAWVKVWQDKEWTIVHTRSGGVETTVSLRDYQAFDIAYALTPELHTRFERARTAENALWSLQNVSADPATLRLAADEVDCGPDCENQYQDSRAGPCPERRKVCQHQVAEDMRELADAIERKSVLSHRPSPSPDLLKWQPTHRHKKRGTDHMVLGNAYLQTDRPLTDMTPMIVYRDEHGGLWVRSGMEFNDGRFEPLPEAALTKAMEPPHE